MEAWQPNRARSPCISLASGVKSARDTRQMVSGLARRLAIAQATMVYGYTDENRHMVECFRNGIAPTETFVPSSLVPDANAGTRDG